MNGSYLVNYVWKKQGKKCTKIIMCKLRIYGGEIVRVDEWSGEMIIEGKN